MTLTVEIQLTNDARDAPLARYRFDDGSEMLRRDDEDPGRPWVACDFFPHALLYVDGQMSEFDATRRLQPAPDPFPWPAT